MIIFILIHVQHLQHVVSSFESFNGRNHSLPGTHHLKQIPLSKISHSVYWMIYPLTPLNYLENTEKQSLKLQNSMLIIILQSDKEILNFSEHLQLHS